jgi:hypothetical protein
VSALVEVAIAALVAASKAIVEVEEKKKWTTIVGLEQLSCLTLRRRSSFWSFALANHPRGCAAAVACQPRLGDPKFVASSSASSREQCLNNTTSSD